MIKCVKPYPINLIINNKNIIKKGKQNEYKIQI
jgi:hypothetical protein